VGGLRPRQGGSGRAVAAGAALARGWRRGYDRIFRCGRPVRP
jgi:hypothetical protein